jgi:hypothetical protein
MTMHRQTALRFQLKIQVFTLTDALRSEPVEPRRLWQIADAVLDTHDCAAAGHAELRAEVVHLMRQIAARRPLDASACAARLKTLGRGIEVAA